MVMFFVAILVVLHTSNYLSIGSFGFVFDFRRLYFTFKKKVNNNYIKLYPPLNPLVPLT